MLTEERKEVEKFENEVQNKYKTNWKNVRSILNVKKSVKCLSWLEVPVIDDLLTQTVSYDERIGNEFELKQ